MLAGDCGSHIPVPSSCGRLRSSVCEGRQMSNKLGIGATFPKLTINLVDGSTLELPDGIDAKYRIILFYRGHW
jgi:hypothetical protein